MGTAERQGQLWGTKAEDWAELGEGPSKPVYEAVFDRAGVTRGTTLLDIGCGAGTALAIARERGAEVTGLDAAERLVRIARARLPGARIEVGEMETLPFAAGMFDVVTGFNSFQFAGDVVAALAEARRVCKPNGKVAVQVWGRREDCESVHATFGAVFSQMPPPPKDAPAAPQLSDPRVLDSVLADARLAPIADGEVDVPFLFTDAATAWRCFASAGAMVGAIAHLGEARAKEIALGTLAPFTRPDGSVLQKNRFRWVLAKPAP
jgi:SAM-dependent methyltransferase